MKKITIKNRQNQKIVVVVEQPEQASGLVFVMHGLSGNKEQLMIVTFGEAFAEHNFTTVRFDTTNTFGESDGDYADATITNYLADLEDVIAWARTQDWFVPQFWLIGHSLGAISTALYAQAHPEEVLGLAPISTVVSGQLSLTVEKYAPIEEYRARGWIEEKKGKRLRVGHIEDRLKYDLLLGAGKLVMPVLMVVGDQDVGTPLAHQRLLFEKLPGEKELHVIAGAPHTFNDEAHLAEIKTIIGKWIEKHQATR